MEQIVRVLVVAPLGVGGVTNMMINIQKCLDRSKINFDYLVIHDRHEPCEEQVMALGSRKLVACVDNVKTKVFRRVIRMNEIRKVCKENHIKIMHYNADSAMDFTNILAAKLGGVKYITIHSHNADYHKNVSEIEKIIIQLMKPFLITICDNYWSCSELAAKFMFPKKIIKERKYSVLPNGIELQKYDFNEQVRRDVREELELQEHFVVGHVGRFSIQKNHAFLLEIFQKIYERDSTSILLLFGEGELMNEMKEKAEKLGISDATIFYGVSNQMEKMWQAMDVFLMPSLHEGLPVTSIEAQASGLPCVFSDCITKEVDLTGKAEFLSLKEEPDIWANAVLNCKGRERIGGSSMLKDASYDIQKTAQIVSDFYLRVAKQIGRDR